MTLRQRIDAAMEILDSMARDADMAFTETAAKSKRRTCGASPPPPEGRLEPERTWSDRHLYRPSEAGQRVLEVREEATFNELAPRERPADVWPGADVLNDLAHTAQPSTQARFASILWATGELAQRGLVLLRATIGILDKNRATGTRAIDGQWRNTRVVGRGVRVRCCVVCSARVHWRAAGRAAGRRARGRCRAIRRDSTDICARAGS